MRVLTPDSIQEFVSRFCHCDDAVLQSVVVEMATETGTSVLINLLTKDLKSSSMWSILTISLKGVSEFLFREGKSSRVVLSDGLTVLFCGSRVWLDLSPYSSKSTDIEDVRKSDLYFSAHEACWDARIEANE